MPKKAAKARSVTAELVTNHGFSEEDCKHFRSMEKQLEQSWLYMADSLQEIHDRKLFRIDGYKDFDTYARTRWGVSKGQASDLFQQSRVVRQIENAAKSPIKLPSIQSHAQEILKFAKQPTDQLELWSATVQKSKESGHPVTAQMIRNVAKSTGHEPLKPPKPKKKQEPPQEQPEEPEVKTAKENVNTETITDIQPAAAHDVTPAETEEASGNNGTEYTGVARGGTTFNPAEFDASMHVDDDKPANSRAHLEDAYRSRKVMRALAKAIKKIHNDLIQESATPGGSFIRVDIINQLFLSIDLQLKGTAFEVNCPGCKNKPDRKCEKCRGRGFLDHCHAAKMTDAERAWVEKDLEESKAQTVS